MKKILRLKNVQEQTGLSKSKIYHLISEEKFPSPINLNCNAVGWIDKDIEQWIDSCIVNKSRV